MVRFIKQLLQEEFEGKLSKEELDLIPSGYQKVGDILIINLKSELFKYEKEIGNLLLEKIPQTRTICKRTDFVTGQFREPNVEVIAGDANTETVHTEHDIFYKLDVSQIMFSKGNLNERKRIIDQIKEGEIVVDMFCGIGYFVLGIAKFSPVSKVYGIEINPVAFKYLCENININSVGEKIVPVFGDCSVKAPELGKVADRIIMGLLPSSAKYLPAAMKTIKDGGIIHYHSVLRKKDEVNTLFSEVELAAKEANYSAKLIDWKRVKSYAPKVDHVVLDCKISEMK